jgi:nicotinamide-nucleotide amidase
MGPTADDLTLDAAALATGLDLTVDSQVLGQLQERFLQRGIAFSPNNQRQARVPQGGIAIPNPFGSAPAIITKIGKAVCYLLPGVPNEFRGLCELEVLPRIEKQMETQSPSRQFRLQRILKVFPMPESHLDTLVKDLPQRHPQVYFGFRTYQPENHLKLIAQGSNRAEAKERLAAAEQDARTLIGNKVFAADDTSFAQATISALRESKSTVAIAESCTGGLCASMLTSVAGASEVLVFSVVAYQALAKSLLLGLDPGYVARVGTVGAPITRSLAEASRSKSGASFGLAITGWAGPGGGTSADPVGTTYICLTDGNEFIEERHRLGTERERIRQFAAYQALDLLRRNVGIRR